MGVTLERGVQVVVASIEAFVEVGQHVEHDRLVEGKDSLDDRRRA